jgi:glucose-1-phosphate thymidylyltransferase
MLIAESETPQRYGVVEVHGGQVKRLVEKPEQRIGNLVSTGIYAFGRSVFEEIAALGDKGRHDLTDVLEEVLARQEVQAVFAKGTWIDAAFPWDLLPANAAALAGLHAVRGGTIEKGVSIHGKVAIGEGTRVRSGTYIQGPCVIGEGCDIGPNAVITPATSLGDDVRLGAFTVVENSIVMDDASLGPHSILQSSVVGAGVRATASLIAAAAEAKVEMEGEWHRVPSLGGMIGEDTVLDAGVVIEPGTILGTRCEVHAGARVRGHLRNGVVVT